MQKDYIIYHETTGQIKFHQYHATEAQVIKLCRVNPGLTYMLGKCHPDGCKVDLSGDTPQVIHVNTDNVMAWLRQRRTLMLKACDWTQAPDSPLSDSKKAEWQTYRQALRDMPDTYSSETNINNIVWPTRPN